MTRRAWVALSAGMFALGAAPWIAAIIGASAGLAPAYVYFCHQRLERTLHLGAEAMAVCSRCAGVHLGFVLGAVLILPPRLLPHGRTLLFATIALNLIEASTGWLGAPLSHAARITCGAAFGWVACGFFLARLRPVTERQADRARTPASC